MVEIAKDISAVVGCISGSIALLTLFCKPLRKWLVAFVQRFSNKDEVERNLQEIKAMMEAQTAENRVFQKRIEDSLDITIDFTEKQCRNIIKNIFYKYKDTKVLPLHEKKTLLDMDELYLGRMRKNHWGKTLLGEMSTWDVDTSSDMQYFDEE